MRPGRWCARITIRGPAVVQQRLRKVCPGELRHCGRQPDRYAIGRTPGDELPAREHHLILAEREQPALPAPIGISRDDHSRRVGHMGIDQQAGQVLGVVDLPAPVCQVGPAGPALAGRIGRVAVSGGRILAARTMEPASGVGEHRVAMGGEPNVVPMPGVGAITGKRAGLEVRLGITPSVQHHDQRQRAAGGCGHGQVGVEWRAVEARDESGADRVRHSAGRRRMGRAGHRQRARRSLSGTGGGSRLTCAHRHDHGGDRGHGHCPAMRQHCDHHSHPDLPA